MSDYNKGYAAGRRRAYRDNGAEHRHALREEFERQVFIAVLPQLLNRPWRTGDKKWTSMDEFVGGARKFARMAGERFSFPLPPAPLPPGNDGAGG